MYTQAECSEFMTATGCSLSFLAFLYCVSSVLLWATWAGQLLSLAPSLICKSFQQSLSTMLVLLGSSKAAPPAHHPCLLSSWWCGCSYLETSFSFKFFNAWLLPTKKIGNCAHSFFNGTHFTVTPLASFPCLSMFTCNISLPYFSIIFGKMF